MSLAFHNSGGKDEFRAIGSGANLASKGIALSPWTRGDAVGISKRTFGGLDSLFRGHVPTPIYKGV